MHIALVIYGSLDRVSGGYLYDRQLVAHWRAAGDTVDVVTLPWRSYGRHLMDNLSSSLPARLMDGGYDVIVQDELNHPSLFWLNSRLPASRPPLISIVHHLRSSEAHPAWQLPAYRAVERRYLETVDGFIFNSETTRQSVAALLGREVAGVVAYPAADHLAPVASRSRIEERAGGRPLRLLFVGNVIRRKGLHTVVRAMGQSSDSDCRLTVVGDQTIDLEYVVELRAAIARLGLVERVAWLGAVDSGDLGAVYQDNHLLVMPSAYEGFGIAYLEGMGYGLPAVATTAGAAGELITDGVDGFLLPPDDAPALAAVLSRVDRDRRLLASMAASARSRYECHPTWAESAALARTYLAGLSRQMERTV